MPFRVTIRSGPSLERREAGDLESALDRVEQAARALAAGPRRTEVDLRYRRWEPGDIVAHRIELSGPGVRGGIDIRGDNTAVPFVGRFRRRAIEPRRGENVYDALRRTLSSDSAEP